MVKIILVGRAKQTLQIENFGLKVCFLVSSNLDFFAKESVKKNIYIDIFLVLGSHLRGNLLHNGKVIAITVRKRLGIA